MKLDRRPDLFSVQPGNQHNSADNMTPYATEPRQDYQQSDSVPLNPELSEKEGKFKKFISTFVMASAFTGLAVLGWYAYEESKKIPDIGQLPLIKANPEPFKIKPKEPSGAHIPNTDKQVFDTISSNSTKDNEMDFLNDSNITFLPQAEEPLNSNKQPEKSSNQSGATGQQQAIEQALTAPNNVSESENSAPQQNNIPTTDTASVNTPDSANNVNVSDNSAKSNIEVTSTNISTNKTSNNMAVNNTNAKTENIDNNQNSTKSGEGPTISTVTDNKNNIVTTEPTKNYSNAEKGPDKSIPTQTENGQNAVKDTKWKVVKLADIPRTPAKKLASSSPAAGEKTAAKSNDDPGKITGSDSSAKSEVGKKQADSPVRKETATLTSPKNKVITTNSGKILVQLGSYKSTDSLEKGWKSLQKKFPDQLNGLRKSVETADLGDKGVFYRLQAGPFSNKEEAQKLCSSLSAKKQGCIVIK